jgi:agmatinase
MQQWIPYNFLGLPENLSRYEMAKVVVLPIPYESTLSFQSGSRYGPQAIISASRQLETYDDDTGSNPSTIGIATLPELEQVISSPQDMQEAIYRACLKILDDGKFVVSLGGEHSITYPLVRAHKDKFAGLSVVQIDAHTDLRDSYQGSKFSHACVMSRVAEIAPFIAVGIRSFSGQENEEKFRGSLIKISQLRNNYEIFEKNIAKLAENVYITIDLDAFDPSVMPSVGTPEPGGLSWDEVMKIVDTLLSQKKVVGVDIVELSPQPGLAYADFTAAKLAYKIIAGRFSED